MVPIKTNSKNNGKKVAEVVPKQSVVAPPAKLPMDLSRFRRPKKADEEVEDSVVLTPKPITSGSVDHIVDLLLNPSRDKIREVTVVDRFQGRMFPQMDMCGALMHYVLEVAMYREDSALYRKLYQRKHPIPPDLHDEFLYRTAQWQKSINAKNLDAGMSLAQAEVESRAEDDGMGGNRDPYADNNE